MQALGIGIEGASFITAYSRPTALKLAQTLELGDQLEPSLDEFLGRIGPVDLVLLEGFKHSAQPKLEVRRSDSDEPVLAESDRDVCAIVSDGPLENSPVPVFDRSDIDGIADFLLQQLGLESAAD